MNFRISQSSENRGVQTLKKAFSDATYRTSQRYLATTSGTIVVSSEKEVKVEKAEEIEFETSTRSNVILRGQIQISRTSSSGGR